MLLNAQHGARKLEVDNQQQDRITSRFGGRRDVHLLGVIIILQTNKTRCTIYYIHVRTRHLQTHSCWYFRLFSPSQLLPLSFPLVISDEM